MKINLVLFVTEKRENGHGELMMKTFESNIRPVVGDIIEDPGFHPDYHNGYEVIKVSIDYASNEIFVSLSPLLEKEDMKLETYIERLVSHGWRVITKEEVSSQSLKE